MCSLNALRPFLPVVHVAIEPCCPSQFLLLLLQLSFAFDLLFVCFLPSCSPGMWDLWFPDQGFIYSLRQWKPHRTQSLDQQGIPLTFLPTWNALYIWYFSCLKFCLNILLTSFLCHLSNKLMLTLSQAALRPFLFDRSRSISLLHTLTILFLCSKIIILAVFTHSRVELIRVCPHLAPDSVPWAWTSHHTTAGQCLSKAGPADKHKA